MSEYSVKRVRMRVVGIPAPKGSARAMTNKKTGKAFVVASGSRQNEMQLRTWRSDVIEACRRGKVPELHPVPLFHPEAPLQIAIVWRIPARAVDLRSDRRTPKPNASWQAAHGRDCDKLERSTWDAITQSQRIWIDDSRAAGPMSLRRYVLPGEWQGADILIALDFFEVVKWYFDQGKQAEAEFARAKEGARPIPSPQQELLK